jgi:hypothetical protein
MRLFHYSDWQDLQSLRAWEHFLGLHPSHPVENLCTVDPIDPIDPSIHRSEKLDPKSLTRKSAP